MALGVNKQVLGLMSRFFSKKKKDIFFLTDYRMNLIYKSDFRPSAIKCLCIARLKSLQYKLTCIGTMTVFITEDHFTIVCDTFSVPLN